MKSPPIPPPDSAPPVVHRLRQTMMIMAGVVVILFAVVNTLFDLGIVSQDDLQELRVRIFYTATPSVPATRQPTLAVAAVTPTPQATPLVIATEERGFLPLQVEQVELTPVRTPLVEEIPLVIPVRLVIAAIDLDAAIVPAELEELEIDGTAYAQWKAPDEFAGGWHRDSAGLGQIGNTVINGHHNIKGEVFKQLDQLVEGDRITIYGEDEQPYDYLVTNVMILEERDVSLEKRLENARWILPSTDERLTLITCWPYYSNTHRLVIVARPFETQEKYSPPISNNSGNRPT